jgi:hypothetical protein
MPDTYVNFIMERRGRQEGAIDGVFIPDYDDSSI